MNYIISIIKSHAGQDTSEQDIRQSIPKDEFVHKIKLSFKENLLQQKVISSSIEQARLHASLTAPIFAESLIGSILVVHKLNPLVNKKISPAKRIIEITIITTVDIAISNPFRFINIID